jgi:lipopolysaccharide heptosyltransferase II
MSAGWDAAGRVLAVRLDAMGDVLMTGPAVRALAEGGRRVTLLTSRSGAAAAELLPGVADVIVYDAPWMKASAARSAAPDRAMIDRLRAGRFDAAVVFTVYSQNPLPAAMLCLLADVPLRLAHCRENPYHLLTDWVRETEPEAGVRHEVRRQLDLLAAVGVRTADERMRVTLPAEAVAHVRQTVRWLDLDDGRPWAVVHPGATAPSRRYPPGLFAEACRRLARAHGVRLVFTGDAGERPLVDEVREAIDAPTESLAGELDLAELAALVAAAPLLVSNNTGPAHLASAVGTPVVDLYALTNPQHTPWLVPSRVLNHDVPCRWCYRSVCPEGHHDCLRRVEPAAVVAAALELLGEPAPPRVAANRSLPVTEAR